MSFEKIATLLMWHKEWLDSGGRSGRQATFAGDRVPQPNFFTHDNRQVFVPWLAPKDDWHFTKDDLDSLRGFHNYPLPPLNLEHSNFRGADFRSIDLRTANFSKANLQNCQFTHSTIDSCLFADADLSESIFSDCSCHDTTFDGATISAARFHRTNLRHVSLVECSLEDVHFDECSLDNVNLSNTSMHKAWIKSSRFDRVNLNDAMLLSSTIDDSMFRRAQMCALKAPNMQVRNVTIDDSNMSNAEIYACIFQNSIMKNCKAERIDFSAGVFRDVTLMRCDFTAARFQGVLMNQIVLDRSRFDFSDFSDLTVINKIWVANTDPAMAGVILDTRIDPATGRSHQAILNEGNESNFIRVRETLETALEDVKWRGCSLAGMRITKRALSSLPDSAVEHYKGHMDVIVDGRTTRKCKVFMCYAREDQVQVVKFYAKLMEEKDIDPWLDVRKLRPGEEWADSIARIIREADIFLVFLSSQSVQKRGFVQREWKIAFDRCLEVPEGHIFVIPIKLDECDVPDKFSQYQWVEYVGKQRRQTFIEVVSSIRSQFARILENESRQ